MGVLLQGPPWGTLVFRSRPSVRVSRIGEQVSGCTFFVSTSVLFCRLNGVVYQCMSARS